MTYEIIKDLIEKLSCDLVLADPDEPESLSRLLPILKQIQGSCMNLSLNDRTKAILKARKIINSVLEENPQDVDKKMAALGELISEFSLSVSALQDINHTRDQIGESTANTPVPDQFEENLDKFASLIRDYSPGAIPDLGLMLNTLDELIKASKEKDYYIFHEVTTACKRYIENMAMENIDNTEPIEKGLALLKSILVHLKRGEAFAFDCSDILQLLKIKLKEDQKVEESETEDRKMEESAMVKPEESVKISDDDMEILIDFVSEAQENLDTIEVKLIELEQDPENKDIINDIFRPFHTIKGVSGFLSLKKVNRLSHTTENFLDSARSGDFIINDIVTDVILESVDILKRLIDKVQQGTETGFLPLDSDVDIKKVSAKLKKLQTELASGEKEPLGEILVQKGNISFQDLYQALEIQKDQPEKKIGEILIEEKKIVPKQVASALMEQKQGKKQVAIQVKVSTEKLDDLVDYAGELVIAQSMLKQKTSNDSSLSQSVVQLGQIVTNMQNIAMSMRMIPIKATFTKMIRLVRDLSRKSDKKITLNMIGEDTEIDRNVVDALYEPMVHMIRNSCDHGIEEKQTRIKQGKPSQGEITLRAYHKGGHIIIEIEDDGEGLDKDRILEKAISTGLITGNEQITDPQIYDLILQPGFSTAKQITDISGRGVGMDVVKSGIEKFRGQLSIDSEKGKGSKFTISFPLTLAIIDGMLVRVDQERYVIPTMAIQKVFKTEKKGYYTVEGKGEMVEDRGNLVPLIRINKLFNSNSEKKSILKSIVVVVESKEEKRALLVDELLGKDEYVIKSLGNIFDNIKGLAGGAILADGRVGLILDINGIFKLVNQ